MKLLMTFLHIYATVVFGLTTASAANLSAFRWHNRLLLIFSPTAFDPAYVSLDRNLTQSLPEVKDRDLIAIRVFEKGPSQMGTQPLSFEDTQRLRERFGIHPGRFTVILIGKDGGVKLVREHPVNLDEIFALIDSMPMRQQEMRQKGRSQ